MIRVLVVRHGQSTWNADGRWQGRADPPLSTLGEEQARAAVRRLGQCDAVWSSDLVRARRTAEIIAGARDLEVTVDARLGERDAGEWTGLTRAEIEDRYPGFLTSGRRPPGYEADGPLAARALEALGAIVAGLTDGSVALVVTHGGVIRTTERALGAESELVPNLGGRWLSAGVAKSEGALALGERALLLDAHETEVTTPQQL